MSQINWNDRENIDLYKSKYIDNAKIEWLLEYGKIRDIFYFKGAIGDRYHIYVATKRCKNIVDIHQIYNGYDYGTSRGTHIAVINNYVLSMVGEGRWHGGGYTLKQLIRQGIVSNNPKKFWKIRYCRSAYFVKLHDGTEFTPWLGMKIDLKTGNLKNKPNKESKEAYAKAKLTDTTQRKRNYQSNKQNKAALARYNAAGGDTKVARGWNATVGEGTKDINWDMIPMDDVFKHRNATLRSNIVEHYGMNAIIASLNTEVIDEDTIDGRKYKLLDVEIPDLSANRESDVHKGLYLEMINPSTGESHFEGIPNVNEHSGWGTPRLDEGTVKAALSWRDNDGQMTTGELYNSKATTDTYVIPKTLT